MEQKDIITHFMLFLASIITTAYSLFSKKEADFKRKVLIGKLLGAIVVSFFIMPAVMEYFNLSVKVTLFFTVITVYGLEELLKASVKRLTKTISADEDSKLDN